MIYDLGSKKDESGMKLLKRILSEKDIDGKNVFDSLPTETLALLLRRAEANQGFLEMFGTEIIKNCTPKQNQGCSTFI